MSERGRALWGEVAGERGKSAPRLALLEQALLALDRADEAARTIAEEGVVVRSKRSGVSRAHPAIRIETEARRQFTAIWKQLGLDREWTAQPATDGPEYSFTLWVLPGGAPGGRQPERGAVFARAEGAFPVDLTTGG
ncbi:MAG: P27 family phage terminase small subunit [Candidatus Sumerlaeota bacterium]|nr:P27 family phage terminase small subunit [Candidatus Sumerlaeota bacterium]